MRSAAANATASRFTTVPAPPAPRADAPASSSASRSPTAPLFFARCASARRGAVPARPVAQCAVHHMKHLILVLALVATSCAREATPDQSAQSAQSANAEVARWERRAQNVTIIRDDWGIPHVYGKTDA